MKMNNELLFTSTQIKNLLRDNLEFIKDIDRISMERKKTVKIKTTLIEKLGMQCAYCGSSKDVEAAHIVPLEVGAITSEKNIVLLCKMHHKLYDCGYMSIADMILFSEAWKNNKLNIIPEILFKSQKEEVVNSFNQVPRKIQDIISVITILNRNRHHGKASNKLKREISKRNLTQIEKAFLLIKYAEALRRRDANGVLRESLININKVNPKLLPDLHLPVYYYENLYIHRLNGLHKEATEIANQSVKNLLKQGDRFNQSLEYVSVFANKLLCELAIIDNPEFINKEYFIANFNSLEFIAKNIGGYWGGRWAINCAAHRLQVYIKAKDKKSIDELEYLRKQYYCLDISNGWTSGFIQSISLLEGLTKVIFYNDYEVNRIGTELLARSFVSRFRRSQHFEGIRDAGFGLAIGLNKLNIRNDLSETIKEIMNITVDGTSYIWPWINPEPKSSVLIG